MRIINLTRGTVLAERGAIARSFQDRLKGLLLTKELPWGQALVIRPCNSIHTIGMSYNIDVLFINSRNQVVKMAADVKPYRAIICWHSRYVIELPAGMLAATGTRPGDKLDLQE
jgi:uncharacterized membrane protein (UPF0127 family)